MMRSTVLQQIRMDTNEVVVPACMQTAKNELLNTMDAVIEAFLASMAREPDEPIRGLVNQSFTHLDNFTTDWKRSTSARRSAFHEHRIKMPDSTRTLASCLL